MITILLYGKFIKKAQQHTPGQGKTILPYKPNTTIKDLLKQISINPQDTGEIRINYKPATLNTIIKDNDRIVIFPKENQFPWNDIY